MDKVLHQHLLSADLDLCRVQAAREEEMDLTVGAEDEAVRQEVRQRHAETLPPNLAKRARLGKHPSKGETKAWPAVLSARLARAPLAEEYGGQGWSVTQRFI